jgi:ER membrane protein complex subunit 3
MVELLLDSKIRVWVFLPIMAITFLVGIIKHYLFIFMSNDKTIDKQAIADSQALIRSRLIRDNGRFIPEEVFIFQTKPKNNLKIHYLIQF